MPLTEAKQTIVKNGAKREVAFFHPDGLSNWYLSIGQGMGRALTFADEKRAYTLSDRGTYIKYRYGKNVPVELDVLVEGDPSLANPYGVIPVNPETHPHVAYDLAVEFSRWLVSERGQSVIQSYRLLGKQLFFPESPRTTLTGGGDGR